MSDANSTVLRRLVAPPPAQLAMTVPRAAETAILRALQDTLGLPARVEDVVEGTDKVPDWTGDIPDQALMLVLAGPGGRSGAAILDPGLWAAIVEMRLTGLLAEAAPPLRPVTAIDTALVEQFVNTVLAQLGARLTNVAQAGWATGLSVARPIEDARLYQFALPEGPMPALRISLTLGGGGSGGRSGELRLLLAPTTPGQGAAPGAGGRGADWAQGMKDGVLGARLALDAVMDQQSVPLASVAAWKPGDLLPIAGSALNAVRLQAAGQTVLAVGRLGQSNGQRAVKLHHPIRAEGLVPPPADPPQALPAATDPTPAEPPQTP